MYCLAMRQDSYNIGAATILTVVGVRGVSRELILWVTAFTNATIGAAMLFVVLVPSNYRK